MSPALVHLVGGTEAGEDLRAERRPVPELVAAGARRVGGGLAGADLVVLAAQLRAHGHVERAGQADLELAPRVEVDAGSG